MNIKDKVAISGVLVIALISGKSLALDKSKYEINEVINRELSGFKNIEFEMTLTDVKKLGFKCVYAFGKSIKCSQQKNDIQELSPAYSFLGQPAKVELWLVEEYAPDYRVDHILVSPAFHPKRVLGGLTSAYGKHTVKGLFDWEGKRRPINSGNRDWIFENGAVLSFFWGGLVAQPYPDEVDYFSPRYASYLKEKIWAVIGFEQFLNPIDESDL